MRAFWLVLLMAALPLTPALAQDNDADVVEVEAVEPESSQAGDSGKTIYKVPDGEGGYIYTDSPPEGSNAEEVKLKPSNSVPFTRRQMPDFDPLEDPGKEQAKGYDVTIVSPEEEQTYRNPVDPIPVRASVQPPLRPGHVLEYYYDGNLLEGPQITYPFRGAHKLVARIRNSDGEVLAESPVRTFFVHRASRLIPPGNP
jgi:hypothetical protein